MSDQLEPQRLEGFASQLAKSRRLWIDHETLWTAFADSFPGFAHSADHRRWFLAALRQLEGRGLIRLPPPTGVRWDRTFDIAVPTSVYLVPIQSSRRQEEWRCFPWHPQLQWVPNLPRLTPEQEAFLGRVHRGLVNGDFRQRAPLKYRSLQLTGKEKRLGELAKTILFGSDRLNWDLWAVTRKSHRSR
jgi:hypothetical protein